MIRVKRVMLVFSLSFQVPVEGKGLDGFFMGHAIHLESLKIAYIIVDWQLYTDDFLATP